MKLPTKRDIKFLIIGIIGLFLFWILLFIATLLLPHANVTTAFRNSITIIVYFGICALVIYEIKSIFESKHDVAKGFILGAGFVIFIWVCSNKLF